MAVSHTGEFRSCVYLLSAPPVFFSVQLPALPQSANAGDSDPLTYAVTAPLCTHNGQKGLTGILREHNNVHVRWVCIRMSFPCRSICFFNVCFCVQGRL